jgi:tRNA-2-methylthio-N6-dimethylallyladenosine synthase
MNSLSKEGSVDGTLQSVSTGSDSKVPSIYTHQSRKPSTFYIKTFGCQMNVADSERMAALMNEKGLKPAANADEAGVIIINGCTVREKAVHKALSQLGQYRHSIQVSGREKPIIGIGGCVGQLEKDDLFRQAPFIDFVFGTDAIDALPEIIHRAEHGERHMVYAEFDKTMDYSTETKILGNKAQAFVNIMKGCDKYCTYCIVPFTRGKEKSRSIDEVLDDCARLVAGGVREITLLGQNVNSFGKNNPNTKNREPKELHNIIGKVGPDAGEENFPQLLRAMDQDPRLAKLKRIRFTSSHPLDFSDELIDCYKPVSEGGVGKLVAQLHLPVQSGSNRVLTKMGRKHKIEHYISQMKRLREINPDIGISTDLIVGFPGETEEEFLETISLLDTVQYDTIYAFAYSPRPGTRAAKLEDDVSAKDKNRRLNQLLQHQLKISAVRYQAMVGKTIEVMVEGVAKRQVMVEKGTAKGRVWTARTECNRVLNFADETARNLTGMFLKVQVIKATGVSLTGDLIHDSSQAERLGLAGDGMSHSISDPDTKIQYEPAISSEVVS